jgi:hypothetical protein
MQIASGIVVEDRRLRRDRRAAASRRRLPVMVVGLAAVVVGLAAPATPAGASPRTRRVAQASPPAVTAGCSGVNVDNLMAQAQSQFVAGFPDAALALMIKALGCKQDSRMYRMAALYACAAHNMPMAQLFSSKLPTPFQGALMQRCRQQNVGPTPGSGAPAAGSTPASGGAAPVRFALMSPSGVRCEAFQVDDLLYEAADRFIAGDARTALSLVGNALACKHDVRTLRMAAIYACVAHDDSAQRYYSELPGQVRPAIRQRCRQENIELVDGPPGPGALGAVAAAAAAAASQASCTGINPDDLMGQAANQFVAGLSRVALALAVKALACKQTVRMYRSATMYACASHDLVAAKRYFTSVPALFQPALVQRCQQDGLDLLAP